VENRPKGRLSVARYGIFYRITRRDAAALGRLLLSI